VKNNFYSRHKELLLKLSSIFLVLLFFIVVEVLVRLIFPVRSADSMIDLGPINLFSKQVIQGETWYTISNKNAYSDRNVLFKKNKEKDQVRIICLGGSASAGWPHPPDEIFTRYLEKALQMLYPSKKIEIINCSAHGFASYRVRQVFESIIPFQPDAVIVWCGNNEFLEKRNYRTSGLENFVFRLRSNYRSYQLVRQLFTKHTFDDTPDVAETFWKKVNEQALELRSNPEQFERVRMHYRGSIESMVEKAEKEKIGLILMTVPVNLRDWEPNVSYLGLNSGDSIRWLKEFREGKKKFLASAYPEAILSFSNANKIAPLHAETCFWLAKSYDNMNDSSRAYEYYVLAKDLDYNPFRVISDFNNTLRTVAKNSRQVVLLDMEKLIRPYAHKGIPGFDLFLDYVHPTKQGNMVIACETANIFINGNLIPEKPVSRFVNLEDLLEINASPYRDEDDPYVQFTRFSLCCMTHQYNSALYFGNLLRNSLPPEMTNTNSGGKLQLMEDAIKTLQHYVEFEIRSLNGESSVEEEKQVMHELKSFYRKYFPYGTF